MKPLYVSFHSGPGYAEEAKGLVLTLVNYGLDHQVRELADSGKWVTNCARKASFLLSMRAEFPDRPLVWLDADARVVNFPTMFDTIDCDVAFHKRWGDELLSGTLYFGATTAASELLEAWQLECQMNPDQWDQRCLQNVIDREPGRWRTQTLPSSYVRIFDAGEMMEPVILHRQASRRLKR